MRKLRILPAILFGTIVVLPLCAGTGQVVRADRTEILLAADAPAPPSNVRLKDFSGRVREVVEIRKRMMELEGRAISQDPELKQMHEQIKTLHEQFRTKLDTKLKDDKEYQDLRTKIMQMQADFQKLRKEWKIPDQPTIMPVPGKH